MPLKKMICFNKFYEFGLFVKAPITPISSNVKDGYVVYHFDTVDFATIRIADKNTFEILQKVYGFLGEKA